MRVRQSAPPPAADPLAALRAPTPTESGVYPIGVFSDPEAVLPGADVEELLRAFSDIGARLRRQRG
jgi:hypothetical protein